MSAPTDPPAPIDVLDLPHLHTRPSASVLLAALSHFVVPPPSWDLPTPPVYSPPGLTKWLTSIIASPLAWIPDENVRETILELASERLNERCGRSAMPPLTRTFRIPLGSSSSAAAMSDSNSDSGASTPVSERSDRSDLNDLNSGDNTVSIVLHEPSLTSDNLGLKTWASSYLLSKRLHRLPLPLSPAARALELGSGTGLVGIAAAAVLRVPVTLTDLPAIIGNLQRNVDANRAVAAGRTEVRVLDWREEAPPEHERARARFELLLAADPLYSREHPRLLVRVVQAWLEKNARARAVVEMPLREGYERERDEFRRRMLKAGLHVLDEGVEEGWDDWGVGGGMVRCWWTVWGWQ